MGKAIGIDLGTTSSVAAFKLADVEVVSADENTPPERKLTRSVVSNEQGKLCVGERAYNQLRADPENVVISIKRLIGRGFSDPAVQEQKSKLGYKITQPSLGTDNSQAINTNNLSKIEIKSQELEKEIRNLPDEVKLVQLCLSAIYHAHIAAPTQANAMYDKLLRMVAAMESGDGHQAQQLFSELQPDIQRWLNQELPSNTIVTGLKR